jgi:hypothetical protein
MSLTNFLLLSRLKMKWYSTPPIWLVFYCTYVIVVVIIPKWTYDNISVCKVPFDKLYTTETFIELSLYSSAVYVATSTVHYKITLHIIDCRYCTTFEVLTVVLLNIQVFRDVRICHWGLRSWHFKISWCLLFSYCLQLYCTIKAQVAMLGELV